MITGFNTDVEYDGRVFHVQTEDKGRENPVVESLVYSGGEIVESQRSSYADLVASSRDTESAVRQRMEGQHQALVRDIRNGRFDPEGPRPFGSSIISNRSLDEVVLDFLARQSSVERIRVEIDPAQEFRGGTSPMVRLRVVWAASELPVEGAQVALRFLSTQERPRELFSGQTDAEGWVEGTVQLPSVSGGVAAVLCQAVAGESHTETQHTVQSESAPGQEGT